MTYRTGSSGFDRFLKPKVAQLSREDSVSIGMRRTYSERLSRKLGGKNERNSLSTNVGVPAKSVNAHKAEKDDLERRLNDYNVSNENI